MLWLRQPAFTSFPDAWVLAIWKQIALQLIAGSKCKLVAIFFRSCLFPENVASFNKFSKYTRVGAFRNEKHTAMPTHLVKHCSMGHAQVSFHSGPLNCIGN